MKLRRLLPVITLGAAMLAAASAAEARTRAVLVGVANYDAPGIHDLLGPRNDVTMIWRALQARQVKPEDIIVLSDGLPAGADFPVARALPERHAILGALDEVAANVRAGDTVMFYYSGHGSVQPVKPDEEQDEPEADGNDQVILPADVGSYDIISRTIRNAIVDNELRAKFDAIRAKGAFVWAVVDACHSGTVTRGEDVVRTVDPSVLDVPPAEASQATRGGGAYSAIALGSSPGGIAGYYAVEAYAEAIERPFTGYDPRMVGEGAKQRMGVFTYHLHRALLRNTASSFRDLAQEIVADMNSDRSGGKVPPPVFDGELDAAVFGTDAARLPGAVTAVLAEGSLTVSGGILHGFDEGAEVAVYLPGQTEKPVAHARVASATPVTSTAAELVWEPGADEKAPGPFSVVVSSPATSFRFRVAPPPASDLANQPENDAVSAAIKQITTGEASMIGIELAEPGDPDADLILRVKSGRLWILRPDRPWIETAGAYGETPSLPLAGEAGLAEADVRDAVWRLARAARLLRVASGSPQSGGEDGEEADLQVSARIISTNREAQEACPKQPPAAAAARALSPLLPVAASHCDLVEIEVKNGGESDYYIAGLYVDSLGGISVVPRAAEKSGCVRTLPMGGDKPLRFSFWINTWDGAKNRPSSVGAENFVLLATPKDDSRQPPRLCALLQPTLSALQKTRAAETGTGGEQSPLQQLLGNVESGATRGSADYAEEEGPAKLTSRLFVFDVKP
jgi:hypothetical protein